jgi:NAD(P)-dependent dehydrogenase (short-subunit alcohol dehydrogenase family)
MRLQGRRILITGAAKGIGRATAELFAKEGARLALLDIDAAALAAVAKQTGGVALEADVRSEAAIAKAVGEAARAMDGIDGVVNCAGVPGTPAPLDTMRLEDWQDTIQTNLTGTFLVCQKALPWLRKAAGRATIVNLASGQALLPTGGSGAYAASKGGVLTFSKDLSYTLAPDIRVNVVCPGTTDTPMVAGIKKAAPHIITNLLAAVPFKRFAEAGEQAAAILFLTCDESSFVTGTALAVDGGRTRH